MSKEAKVYAEKAKKRVRSSRENGMSDLRKKQKTISTDTYNRLTKYVSIVWGRGVGVVVSVGSADSVTNFREVEMRKI